MLKKVCASCVACWAFSAQQKVVSGVGGLAFGKLLHITLETAPGPLHSAGAAEKILKIGRHFRSEHDLLGVQFHV